MLAKTLATLAFAFGGIHVGAHQILHVGYAPAWSPNGLRVKLLRSCYATPVC